MRTLILPFVLCTSVSLIVACGKSADNATTNGATTGVASVPVSKSAAGPEPTERAADTVQSSGVPASVAGVATHAEDLYDVVKASDWTKAKVIMDSLEQSASALTPKERSELSGTLDSLRRAIAGHQREPALEGANRVTFLDAKLTESYHPVMPADVVRLDYYGRELEIWAAQGNMSKLSSTAADLRRTWEAVKPSEISHGGTAAAARADSLVARLAAATSPADYARIAKPFLDVVDELEKPFAK